MKNMERNETIMKKYISIRNRKKSRGVAVIFTLGILGLLTVMALGFASTALLNRKIADNTSSADYARHIAKNIAFARAKNAVLQNAVFNSCYSTILASYTDANGKTSQDFLHKMDTVLDGVELYRVTNESGTIQPNTARWQYVTDPDGKILGRYAYAIVPDSGHLDPVGNRGQTSVSGRYGLSEKEIGVYSMCNTVDGKKGLNENADSAAGIKFRTFKEFAAAFKDLDADKKKNLLTNGYRIQLGPSPEAFWIDNPTSPDGKKTKDELYLRFNMPTTSEAWADDSKISVDKLIGEGADTSDANIKYTGSKTSINFIPWLKNWNHSVGSSWTADVMKKQIAANIIQYNLPGPDETTGEPPQSKQETISDKDADWLTDPPTYAGIGRHPMLNEIGFYIRVKAEVDIEDQTKPEETTTRTIKYTPIFTITLDSGAELIYPFGPASGLKNSEIAFSGTKYSNTIPNMLMRFKLRKFQKNADGGKDPQDVVDDPKITLIDGNGVITDQMLHPTHIDDIIIQTTGEVNKIVSSSTVISVMHNTTATFPWLNDKIQIAVDSGCAWTGSNLSLDPGDWAASHGYTKASVFWKECKTGKQQKLKIPIRSFTVTTKRTLGSDGDISQALAKGMKIEFLSFTPGTVVLKYNGTQRDVVFKLKDVTPPSSMNKMDSEKVWLVSYEAKDPLVNHYASDWTENTESAEYSVPLDINKKYPGSVFNKTSGSDGDDTYHLNSTVKDSSGNPVELLKDKEMKADETGLEDVVLESATDPACSSSSRLSSSYIRHAPMRSLWELGFISRAEAFKTLNLGRVRVFEPGTSYTARGGGSFAQGDANILDQIKFSDTTDQKDAQGKIDLNARYHKVFEWVFNKDTATSEGTTVNWYTNLITTGSAIDPYATTTVSGTTKNVVCSNSSSCFSEQHSDSCTATCLAHLLMERSMILPFRNRSDVLLDPDSTESDFTKIPGYGDLSADAQTKLKTIQRKLRRALLYPGLSGTPDANAGSKLAREQYATRFMNLFKADNNDEHIYIIVLAQSIKDIGGSPVFVDWDGDGEYAPEAEKDFPVSAKGMKSGYVRKKLDNSGYELVGSKTKAKETIISTTVGTYDYGADKITGETKLIVEMAKDANTGKWKIEGYRYVE